MAQITLEGNPINTNGELPAVGSQAPAFKLTDGELNDRGLEDYKGKKKLLNIVVSLDTSICADSTKRFNTEVADDAVVLIISADLPFAQGRICSEVNADKVVSLSMMRNKNFAKDYGVLIQDGPLAGLTARSIVVLDENDKVIYTEQVPEIAQEPNYDAALAALAGENISA